MNMDNNKMHRRLLVTCKLVFTTTAIVILQIENRSNFLKFVSILNFLLHIDVTLMTWPPVSQPELAIYTVHTVALALEYFVFAIVFHQNLLQWFSLYYAAQSPAVSPASVCNGDNEDLGLDCQCGKYHWYVLYSFTTVWFHFSVHQQHNFLHDDLLYTHNIFAIRSILLPVVSVLYSQARHGTERHFDAIYCRHLVCRRHKAAHCWICSSKKDICGHRPKKNWHVSG